MDNEVSRSAGTRCVIHLSRGPKVELEGSEDGSCFHRQDLPDWKHFQLPLVFDSREKTEYSLTGVLSVECFCMVTNLCRHLQLVE